MTNQLNAVFTREFIEAHKDLSTREEILAAVAAELPEVTMADLDAYFAAANAAGSELDESALDQVAGGVIQTGLAIITFAYGAGYVIGQAIKNWKK